MARHYSTKDFFRQMPNGLLARYFHGHGLFRDLEIGGMNRYETHLDRKFERTLAMLLKLKDLRSA